MHWGVRDAEVRRVNGGAVREARGRASMNGREERARQRRERGASRAIIVLRVRRAAELA